MLLEYNRCMMFAPVHKKQQFVRKMTPENMCMKSAFVLKFISYLCKPVTAVDRLFL